MRGSRKQHEDKQLVQNAGAINGFNGSLALITTTGTVSAALGTAAIGPVLLGVGACAVGGIMIHSVLQNLFSE